MKVNLYWITAIDHGQLAIMARPRGGDWLIDEIASLKEQYIDVVVSLLTEAEIIELDLIDEAKYCYEQNIAYHSFAIEDRDVPLLDDDYWCFIKGLKELLAQSKNIVIHCRQGVGRASLIAASIMVTAKIDPDIAFTQISKARGCNVPDTDEQYRWVKKFANKINKYEEI